MKHQLLAGAWKGAISNDFELGLSKIPGERSYPQIRSWTIALYKVGEHMGKPIT